MVRHELIKSSRKIVRQADDSYFSDVDFVLVKL